MPYYRAIGEIPRKRHVRFRRPDGGLYSEELMGEEGFVSDSSLLYHVHPPTAIVKSEGVTGTPDTAVVPNHPLLPRHFRTGGLDEGGDLVLGRQLLLANDDVRISFAAPSDGSGLYRNSTGDEVVYLSAGSARFESVYGSIEAVPGDYVVVPRGTIHRWIPSPAGQLAAGQPWARALIFEASGHVRPPKRYLSAHGQFLEHAPYSERGLSRLTYARHPFDVVGWDGCLYPYAFNIADFEPIVKRTHAPPPVHQTFEGPNFVICSFCPRPLDFDAEAVPLPYNHHNVDSDEMMFYTGGDYTARKGSGVGLGSITLHPAGFTHGPQPGAVEAAIRGLAEGKTTTDETAVMIDTFRPLLIGPAGQRTEDPEYPWSWAKAARG
jgi:homogentisate 1,2-dioxygenase